MRSTIGGVLPQACESMPDNDVTDFQSKHNCLGPRERIKPSLIVLN